MIQEMEATTDIEKTAFTGIRRLYLLMEKIWKIFRL